MEKMWLVPPRKRQHKPRILLEQLCVGSSWMSPLGRALMKSAAGDSAVLQASGRTECLIVLDVCYERIPVEPFCEPLE